MATQTTPRATTRFGHGMLAEWALDPDVLYLNHGTVGAPPRRVLAAQQAIRGAIEARPSQFLLRELTSTVVGVPSPARPRMRVAADAVAAFVGGAGDDLVFVDNATTGANAVMRSLDLREGDEILVTDLGYGGVTRAVLFAARTRGAVLKTVTTPFPAIDPGAFVAAVAAAIGPRTRLAVIDHITSESALILPLAEIAAACAARGVPVLADGAHAPGQLPLDIPALGVTWYTGNLHKWAWSPRSCGILWAERARQSQLHPTVISWGLDQGYTAEFDLPGTRDPSPHLAAPHAIAYMTELGVDAVRAYNHALAWEGAQRLARTWGTRFETCEAMIGAMATVPLPGSLGGERADAARLRDALLFKDRIEVQVHAARGGLWARVSGQIYLEPSDLDRLGEAVAARA